jgi:hypothetical protein
MHPGVSESIVLLATVERRRRELQADAGGGPVNQPPSPTRRQRWAWLGRVGRVVARRGAVQASGAGEAAGAALASAQPELRG